MCGISGFAGPVLDDRSADIVSAQLAALRHRGLDASGSYEGERGVVAQNRLAIIDTVTGDPPIETEDGSIGVALNGEIYNFQQLRGELVAHGHQFRTRGDTEVIAHLAEDCDPVQLARRLDGMFAIAIWDDRRGRLILVRDRLGKKPLYYWAHEGRLVFASEIKGVLAHPDVPRRLASQAIPAYLTFGYVPTPHTFYDAVYSLPPGHILVFEPRRATTRVERYWEPPISGVTAAPATMSQAEAARRVRSELEAAVSRRLISDVPLGAFLSGGLDSSAIVALMARQSSRPVKTFTIGFEEGAGFDERPLARIMANRYGTDHHEFVVSPDAVELIEELVWHHDAPFGDSSAIPTYLLAKATRAHVTVALTGDGGDELFAGYERFAAALAASRWRRVPSLVRGCAEQVLTALPPGAFRGRSESARRFVTHAALGPLDAYRSWLSFLPETQRLAALENADDWAIRDYADVWAGSAGAPLLARFLDLNLRTYLVDDLLVKADRMSMAHALEVRSPFLDRDFVDLSLRLPPELKIRGLRRKVILAEAIKDLVPSPILRRRKRGFAVPLDQWFRTSLRPMLDDALASSKSRVRRRLAPAVIDELLREHASGRRNHGQALWMLVTLEWFLRREAW